MPPLPLPPPIAGYAPEPSQNLADPEARHRLSPAAIAGFGRIADLWQISAPDADRLLGGRVSHPLPLDVLTRISLLIGIFKALNILFSQPLADRWIRLPNRNPIFRGATPLAHMLAGGLPAMIEVRRLLDSRRGGQ